MKIVFFLMVATVVVIWQSFVKGIEEDTDDEQSGVSLPTNGIDSVADTMVVFHQIGRHRLGTNKQRVCFSSFRLEASHPNISILLECARIVFVSWHSTDVYYSCLISEVYYWCLR